MIAEWHLLDTGYCTVRESHAYPGGGARMVAVHAVVALLRHEQQGWFLFDTGYAPRMREATKHWPYSIYGAMTPVTVEKNDAVVYQLSRFGLTQDAIKTIILSHFHADHISGLLDFPEAQFVCSRSAYDAVKDRTGFAALRKAFLPMLLPKDFSDRARFTEQGDLFHDGSVNVVPLPGHAAGQIGLRVQTVQGETLYFVADAAYSAQAIRDHMPPHPITRFFTEDTHAAAKTLAMLHTYHNAQPGTLLLPTHCPETFARCTR